MPRGERTRIVSARIPESLASEVEQRAQRAGQTLGDAVQAALLGTFRYPGSVYVWADAPEREKMQRQLRSLRATNAKLIARIKQYDAEYVPEYVSLVARAEKQTGNFFAQVKEAHARLIERERAEGKTHD